MKRALILFFVIIMLWACKASMPEWFKHRDEYFPPNEYLVAKAWGNSPEKAIEEATIALSYLFNTKVSVEKNILERYESISDEKNMVENYYEYSEEMAKLITQQHLINVKFMDPIRDPKRRQYFTIAYMNRAETSQILMNRIAREEEKINYYVKIAESSADPIERYQYTNAAWLRSAKQLAMQEQLDILAPGLEMKSHNSFKELTKKKQSYAQDIQFKIIARDHENERIKQAISQAVNKAGFSVVNTSAILKIYYSSHVAKIDLHQDPLIFVAWDFNLKLNNWQDETLLSLYEEGREGSTDIKNATFHAIEHMQDYIQKEFQNELVSYFDILNDN
jgi:hypothetical protein